MRMTTTARRACWSPRANGPLMARKINNYPRTIKAQAEEPSLTWAFSWERVTRIELALSAWEVERLRLSRTLTCKPRWSWVTVVDPSLLWLMAR